VSINKDNLVMEFKEKNNSAGSGYFNCGIYLINKKLLIDTLARGQSSMEYDFFPKVAGKNLYGFQCNGRFIDIGIPESYQEAQNFFKL
jgi:D-glycero-alpha-D-manno-heptose 1-phosphate guanylyltransferase